jgi:serine/threonine protein kinase
MGSLLYMAPEVWRCEPYSCKVDVFGFGLVAWEMLTGHLLSEGMEDTFDAFAARARGMALDGWRPRLPHSWPPAVRRLVSECWAEQSDKRPTMAEVICDLLEIAACREHHAVSLQEEQVGASGGAAWVGGDESGEVQEACSGQGEMQVGKGGGCRQGGQQLQHQQASRAGALAGAGWAAGGGGIRSDKGCREGGQWDDLTWSRGGDAGGGWGDGGGREGEGPKGRVFGRELEWKPFGFDLLSSVQHGITEGIKDVLDKLIEP